MSSKKQFLLIIILLSLNLNFFYSDFIVVKSNGIYGTPRRIVAIGDLHGDYEQTIKVLQLAKIIDDDKNWTSSNGILVQTVIIVFKHYLNF